MSIPTGRCFIVRVTTFVDETAEFNAALTATVCIPISTLLPVHTEMRPVVAEIYNSLFERAGTSLGGELEIEKVIEPQKFGMA